MLEKVHTLRIEVNWALINIISQVDRFDASWSAIERREGKSLKELKSIATVRSVGASTRIEGSKMSDDEVGVLLENLNIDKLEDRDAQEVAGYFEVLDRITDTYEEIPITENSIKGLHNTLMKYSEKDSWHRGSYKQLSNSVEATTADGTKQIIFETTPPGYPTEDAMLSLMDWYYNDMVTHPLVKIALFTYEFVSIHPFQDGNGRMSRLLTTLLLLKHGYTWIQYVSLEHEIESRKVTYYKELRHCQAQRPGENVTTWVAFFLDALSSIQKLLLGKLELQGVAAQSTPKEKSILVFIGSNPGCRSGHIAKKLGIPNPTVKRILGEMVKRGLIEKHGTGPGTNYTLI